MGTFDPIWSWDFLNTIYNLKEVFGNRKNFWKWKIRRQEIEQELYFKLLSLGYHHSILC